MDRQLRDLLDAAVGEPPHQVSAEAVRRRVTRHRAMKGAAGAAAVAVIAAAIPVGMGALGNTAARPRPGAAREGTAYVINSGGGAVTPINLATNTPGKPIKVNGEVVAMVIAPDGKTAYVATSFTSLRSVQGVTPIDLTTGMPGKPINLRQPPDTFVITPDGKTAYVINGFPSQTVTPVNLTTGTPGRPIAVSTSDPLQVASLIAMAPDGKIYIAAPEGGTRTPAYGDFMPFDLATGRAGKPIKVSGAPVAIVIAPDGTTAYVMSYPGTVTPVDLRTGTAGKPIIISRKPVPPRFVGDPFAIAISPDGSTAYVANGASGTVTPVNLTTGTPGKPISIKGEPGSDAIAITPDGSTAYVANQPSGTVTPINLTTGTPGKPIKVGHSWNTGFEAIAIVP
jgi:DNA-binding beta-propeller fold protein YncE